MISTNKRASESFVVNKAAQTTIPVTGTIYNSSTLNVNLADGQLGLVADSMFGTVALNSFVDATPTIAEAPVLAIYQGTGQSASVASATAAFPLTVKSHGRTSSIDGRMDVKVTKQAYRLPEHSVWVIGNTDAAAGEINVAGKTEYALSVGFRGYRVEEHYSAQSAYAVSPAVVTPDFTGLSISEKAGRSWIIHNLAYAINKTSSAVRVSGRLFGSDPILALAISTQGGAGTAIGGLTPITTGTVLPVVNTPSGVQSLVLTESMATSIKNAALAVAGGVIADLDWTVMTIDLATAYTVSPAETDVLMLIGLDSSVSYVDRIPQVKNGLVASFTRGFDVSVRKTQASKANEGQGLARQLRLWYTATQAQREYNNLSNQDPIVTVPDIFENTTYVTYNVLHGDLDQIDTTNLVFSPKNEIICIPSSNTTLISTFDTSLNNWLGSAKNNNQILAFN